MKRVFLPLTTGLLLAAAGFSPAEYFDETRALTLFAFDTVSIPYTQNLRIEMRPPVKCPENPVVRRGAPGTPDAQGVQFYGSVIREKGKFRMWYVAFDDDIGNKVASARWRPAYAESDDGLHWVKPNLGLVEFRGSRENNLVQIEPVLGFVNLKVLAEPSGPDPERRYKMTAHVYFRHNTRLGTLAPFTSPDGFHWKMVKQVTPKNAELLETDLVLPGFHFEPSGGLYKWNGLYYACGQNAMTAPQPYHGRVVRMYRSADFVHWSSTSSIAFVRDAQRTLLGPGRSLEGEQCHEGISVWSRGNVLLGLVGQWHGAREWKDITIDLGFVLSNDGLSFREPAHEWTCLPRGEDGAWDQGGVLQGQGFENVGEQTLIYYGAWDPRHSKDAPARGGVGVAMLPRDRFGDLGVDEAAHGHGDYQQPETTCEFVTIPLPMEKESAPRFFVNADGLGPGAALRVELLDEMELGLPGYSGGDAAIVRENGFQTPVTWRPASIGHLPERARLHVIFEGPQRTAIRLSAIYLQKER